MCAYVSAYMISQDFKDSDPDVMRLLPDLSSLWLQTMCAYVSAYMISQDFKDSDPDVMRLLPDSVKIL